MGAGAPDHAIIHDKHDSWAQVADHAIIHDRHDSWAHATDHAIRHDSQSDEEVKAKAFADVSELKREAETSVAAEDRC